MINKELLKQHVKFSPRERRLELIDIIENDMSESEITKALRYMEEINSNGSQNQITKIDNTNGQLSLTTEIGITFL